MKEIKMPSGAVLKVGAAPFQDAKELYQVVANELKAIKMDGSLNMDYNFFKDIACSLLSSKKYETALNKCFEKCLYNGEKFSEDTFEPVKAREDYLEVCFEVSRENLLPFTKTLMQKYSAIMDEILTTGQE